MNMRLSLLFLLLPLCAQAQVAVDAFVTGAYDGDTIHVEAQIWPRMTWKGNVRVLGVDTPEIHGKCDLEKQRARTARDYVRTLLTGRIVRLTHIAEDKYGGRVDARVIYHDPDTGQWRNLANELIRLGMGRAYDGGTRQGWCPSPQ